MAKKLKTSYKDLDDGIQPVAEATVVLARHLIIFRYLGFYLDILRKIQRKSNSYSHKR
jgi:hypothetical protein